MYRRPRARRPRRAACRATATSPSSRASTPPSRLTRTQTIMQGASHCDFRFVARKAPATAAALRAADDRGRHRVLLLRGAPGRPAPRQPGPADPRGGADRGRGHAVAPAGDALVARLAHVHRGCLRWRPDPLLGGPALGRARPRSAADRPPAHPGAARADPGGLSPARRLDRVPRAQRDGASGRRLRRARASSDCRSGSSRRPTAPPSGMASRSASASRTCFPGTSTRCWPRSTAWRVGSPCSCVVGGGLWIYITLRRRGDRRSRPPSRPLPGGG